MIFLRFKIETLEYYFAKYLINKGIQREIQIPLPPQNNFKKLSKTSKSYDFRGFFFFKTLLIPEENEQN